MNHYSLPERPSLEYLRKQAKDIHRSHQRKDRSVCEILRAIKPFNFASDDEILAEEVMLGDVQHALAMAYGFSHWAELMSRADELAREDPSVRRSRRVQIDGVEGDVFDTHWDMPARAVRCLLRSRGVEAEPWEVLGMSSDAFSLCHASHFQCVAYLCTPTNPVANAVGAYGFAYDSTHAGQMQPFRSGKTPEQIQAHTEQVLDRIRASIDAGWPVMIAGAEAHCGSMSLIVGYEKDRDWFCHVGDDRPYRWTPLRGVAAGAVDEDFGLIDGRCRGTVAPGFVGGWQAYPVYLLGQRVQQPTDSERITKALRFAVTLHEAPEFAIRHWGGVRYFFGRQAYEQWAAELEGMDYPGDLKGPYETTGFGWPMGWYSMGNIDMQVDQIVTGRSAAAEFCRWAAEVLDDARSEQLRAAARWYDEEVAIAQNSFAAFLPRFDGDDERRAKWLSEPANRSAGADAILKMLACEENAVAAIRGCQRLVGDA